MTGAAGFEGSGITYDGFHVVEKADPRLNVTLTYRSYAPDGEILKTETAGAIQPTFERASITFDGAHLYEFYDEVGP